MAEWIKRTITTFKTDDTSNITPLISPTVATEDAKKCLICLFRASVETRRCNMVDGGRGPALSVDDYKVTD